jgi:hypothetical protein
MISISKLISLLGIHNHIVNIQISIPFKTKSPPEAFVETTLEKRCMIVSSGHSS